MGLPTARTVAAAGHMVQAFDIKPLTADETAGLTLMSSAREAAQGCDLICVALFSDDQVEEVLMGAEGIFPILEESAVVAVFTTGTIASAKALAAAAPPGVAVLDTCFSRQSWMMASGKLNLLVGGDAAALDRARPVLQTFAQEILHMGGSGAGRAIKLVNNLLWTANHRLAVDTLDFAESLGLDPHLTAEIILKCSGATDAFHVYLNPEWQKTFDFMHPYFVKDASAAVEAAREVGCDLGALRDVVKPYVEG
jgi:3-hydroxyisobutyrate dehydrogenase-like beta-hydroxyacid dehydrogenase